MKTAFTIEESPVFRVILPSQVNWSVLLIFASVAAVFNVTTWMIPTNGSGGPELAFRIASPLLAVAAVGLLLWSLFGREIVSFEGFALVVRYELLGMAFCREFDRNEVRNLRPRAVPSTESWKKSSTDSIAFDYGPQTFTFGNLEPTDAVHLAEQLVQRFPELKPVPPVVIHSF